MKHFNTLIIIIILQNFAVLGQTKQIKKNDTTICLQTIGLALDNDTIMNGAQVFLYKENEELEWNEITSVKYHDHNFIFNLLGNSHYTIKVTKPGYVERSISISTVLPEDIVINGDIFIFEFEVTLFKEKKGIDDYYLDFPVALISYNKSSGVFENSDKYTKHIKSKINEALSQQQSSSVNILKGSN